MKKITLIGITLVALVGVVFALTTCLKSDVPKQNPTGIENQQDAHATSTDEEGIDLSQTYQNTRYHYSFKYPNGYHIVGAAVEDPGNTPIGVSDGVGLDDGQNTFSGFAIHRLPNSPESLPEYAAQMLSAEYGVDIKTVRDNVGHTTVSGLDAYRIECLRNCAPVSSSRVFVESLDGSRFEVVVLNGVDLPERVLKTLSFQK